MVEINMPVMNGIEFSKKLLKISLNTEVVIITGEPDEDPLSFPWQPATAAQTLQSATKNLL